MPVWVPIAAMLAAFLGGTMRLALLAVASRRRSRWTTRPEGVTLGATLAQDLLLVVVSLLAVKVYEGGVRPDWFGLRRTPFWPAVGACAVMMGGLVGLRPARAARPRQARAAGAGRGAQVRAQRARARRVRRPRVRLAPICEELFFRGLMFRAFADRMGIVAGAALSGAIFGLVHLPAGPLVTGLVLFGLGFGFALLRWWTGSLLPSMALHAINNSYLVRRDVDACWWIVILVLAGSTALVLAIGLWMANSTWGRLNA